MTQNFTSQDLYQIIQERLQKKPAGSYVAQLAESGFDRAAQKIGEEAVETVIAAKNYHWKKQSAEKELLIGEMSDLFFHSLVVLALLDIQPTEIMNCLKKRHIKQVNKKS